MQSKRADRPPTTPACVQHHDISHLDAARTHGTLALRAAGSHQVLRPLQQLRRHALACSQRSELADQHVRNRAWPASMRGNAGTWWRLLNTNTHCKPGHTRSASNLYCRCAGYNEFVVRWLQWRQAGSPCGESLRRLCSSIKARSVATCVANSERHSATMASLSLPLPPKPLLESPAPSSTFVPARVVISPHPHMAQHAGGCL